MSGKQPKEDVVARMHALTHLYLLELSGASLREKEHYTKSYINEAEVIDDLLGNYPDLKIKRNEIGPIRASLLLTEYILIFNVKDKEEIRHVFVQPTQKGVLAHASMEFWQKIEQREIERENRELVKRSLLAHKQQKFINWGLVVTAFLAALSPIAVALWFDKPQNIVVSPSYDIRNDSSWIRGQFDSLLQKSKAPTPLKVIETEKLLPKGGTQQKY